jgi:spore coat polysaccharide biosynthesis protein SpsF (cytidylyltransferase family)
VIAAIIQARNGSTRLPGKSMALIEGKPLIEHVCDRVNAAQYVNFVCVATTDQPEDDELAKHVESLGVDVYRGSADDVLGRFYWAVERYPEADVIVRITGDDPFKDPALIDQCIEMFLLEWAEPRADMDPPQLMHLGGITWALGTDVEVFTRNALNAAYQCAQTPFDREHVTPWIERVYGRWVMRDNENRRTINTRHTIDTEIDLVYAQAVYSVLYKDNPLFGYADVCEAGF